MERLCFLSPSLEAAREVVTDLKENGIPTDNVHVIASPGLDMDRAFSNKAAAKNLVASYSGVMGAGGAGGLVTGLLLRALGSARLAVGGGAVLMSGLLGAGVAGLLTRFSGGGASKPDLKHLEAALEEGKVLVVADVEPEKVEKYQELVRAYEPGTRSTSMEPPARLIPR